MPLIAIRMDERWPDYYPDPNLDEFSRSIEIDQATLDRWKATRAAYAAYQNELNAIYEKLYEE